MSYYKIKIIEILPHPDPACDDTIKRVAELICENNQQIEGAIKVIEALREEE